MTVLMLTLDPKPENVFNGCSEAVQGEETSSAEQALKRWAAMRTRSTALSEKERCRPPEGVGQSCLGFRQFRRIFFFWKPLPPPHTPRFRTPFCLQSSLILSTLLRFSAKTLRAVLTWVVSLRAPEVFMNRYHGKKLEGNQQLPKTPAPYPSFLKSRCSCEGCHSMVPVQLGGAAPERG